MAVACGNRPPRLRPPALVILMLLGLPANTHMLDIPLPLVGSWNATSSTYRVPVESQVYSNQFEQCIVERRGDRKNFLFARNTTDSKNTWPVTLSAFECPIEKTENAKDPRDAIFSTQVRGLLSASVETDNFFEGISDNTGKLWLFFRISYARRTKISTGSLS